MAKLTMFADIQRTVYKCTSWHRPTF